MITEKTVKTIANFYFSIEDGGVEKVMALLIRKWKKMGYKIVIFTDKKATKDDYIDADEAERIILPLDYGTNSKRRAVFEEAIKKYDIDIMVYHAWGNPIMRWDREVFQDNKIPFIVYTHGVFSTIFHDRNTYSPFFIDEIKKCDSILSLTRVSQRFYELLGIRSIYIQNPIEEKLYSRSEIANGKNVILWVGRLIPEKKPLDAIKIFANVKKKFPDVRLVVVGQGPEENAIKELIVNLNLKDSVELTGYTKEVEIYYKDAAILLYTSMYEGFSMVLLESKAYGLPCVMYELPYLSMTENPKGIVEVAQDDVAGASSAVIELLTDEGKRTNMSHEARKSLEDMYESYDDEIWREIFHNSFQKYSSQRSVDSQMLELLLEHQEYGVRKTIEKIYNSKTYKLGDLFLKIPKKVVNSIRKDK